MLAEASHLLSKDDPAGPADIVRLGAAGLFEVVLRADEHWGAIERTLRKYVDLRAALADACLIRCAEIHDEPRILTFDRGFPSVSLEREKAVRDGALSGRRLAGHVDCSKRNYVRRLAHN